MAQKYASAIFSGLLALGLHNTAFGQLPAPTGPYCVGKMLTLVEDPARPEIMTEDPNDYRRLSLGIWYPSECTGNLSLYMHPKVTNAFLDVTRNEHKAELSYISNIVTSSRNNAPFSKKVKSSPILFFSHGFGFPTELYTTLYEHLASNGYVIVTIPHTYNVAGVLFPDGEIYYRNEEFYENERTPEIAQILQGLIAYLESDETTYEEKLAEIRKQIVHMPQQGHMREMAKDFSLAIDTALALNADRNSIFYKKLDADKIGAFGHSYGGAASANVLFTDDRVKAASNVDGGQWGIVAGETFEEPFLFLSNDQNSLLSVNRAIFLNAGEHFTRIRVKETMHRDFSDLPFFSTEENFFNTGKLEPARNAEIFNDVIQSFFDATLRNDNEGWASLLDRNPELVDDTSTYFNVE